ncbi:MAG: 2-(1,2-epoxy-1,2-dihydrophenyl)acetyl-CoA isomerase [Candidatus Poriferisodalaceae bacterium]|jgi:2-(1,2-epoxy-1,2-dihydrophenyl)acetyl-CoA isomerase
MASFERYAGVEVELRDNGVVVATLNRPERLNSFNGAMRQDIHRLLCEVTESDDARALVMTGAGRAFCSGADLTAEDRRGWPIKPHEPMFGWGTSLLEMPKPTVCALNGLAAGGGLGLALLFDIRVCSEDARLMPIWMKRAIHPDDLITWTLPRLVGYSRALEWLYLAEEIPVEMALVTGMVNHVRPSEDVLPAALEIADRLALAPPAHMAMTKKRAHSRQR